MKPINDAHVARSDLAVVEIAADDDTVFAVQHLLAARCAIAPADRTTREPGEPGVRLRCSECPPEWLARPSLSRNAQARRRAARSGASPVRVTTRRTLQPHSQHTSRTPRIHTSWGDP
ncbi:DUF6207 family protein [Streptomyces sp. NPDC057621]|uniref:DUF6207 family protein n=1 Tax=Streptomyces sp. NPDC057621 TaxID=3346186 RepID=UPI0036C0EBA6